MTLPHSNTYNQICVSSIRGVGVIAIMDIPIGTYLFSDDKSKGNWYKEDELGLSKLPGEIQKLYTDFCGTIHMSGVKMYGCPDSFNNLTVSWYLNNSDDPNVPCDKNFDFYTIRDIKMGEELTFGYSTYCVE